MIKIAHLTDLHFSKITIFPLSFKRLIGCANLLINRKKSYIEKHLLMLPELLKSLDVKNIFISGDLTSTSLEKEFEKAKKFIQKFTNTNFFVIPGNHDSYTKKAVENFCFYNFFKNVNSSENLNSTKSFPFDHKIQIHNLSDKWVYIGLDTTTVTPLFSASGLFSEDLEENLIKVLDKIPKEKNIVLVNHFPIFHKIAKRKRLKRRDNLLKILKKYQNIKLYLHGHTHKWSITKKENLPYMICSGCSSHKKNASFNILEIEDDKCLVTTYAIDKNTWKKEKTTKLDF